MNSYLKHILTIQQQLQSYIDAGMTISSPDEAERALKTIGYYRLRGYCFHLYDNTNKTYYPGTDFSDILHLCYFDTDLSHLLFKIITSIEISLRSHLIDALLIYNDALILFNPQHFTDKKLFWKNLTTLSGEIARSNDVFIQHHFQKHHGNIPVWAAVEIMSFGNLSKTIKNLKSGINTPSSHLLNKYCYLSPKGNLVKPSLKMFSSWIQAVSVLRNLCAHHSRIYNRTISTHLQIPSAEHISNHSAHNGLYQITLAMKYLSPNSDVWQNFISELEILFKKYQRVIELNRMNFPKDWKKHLTGFSRDL